MQWKSFVSSASYNLTVDGQTQTEPRVKSYDFEKLLLQHTSLYTEENDPVFANIWIYSLDYIMLWSAEITIFTKLKLLIARNQFVHASHKWHIWAWHNNEQS